MVEIKIGRKVITLKRKPQEDRDTQGTIIECPIEETTKELVKFLKKGELPKNGNNNETKDSARPPQSST